MSYKVDNAIIMAAGTSSRFVPLSYELPKALITVKGEVLIERQIRQLKEAGINEIVVVTGYKKELLYYLRKTLFFYERVKGFVLNIWEGIMSLKGVRNIPLFIFYTLAIWACYFLHFYFTFYCFAFTAHLGILAALVMFVGGTFAVIVPTPNGAGPWHFAIISMMMLYGVNVTDAGIFALIVHGIQTFLVVLLGVYGLAALPFTNRHRA